MSYPKNKRERLLIGRRKGRKRVALWICDSDPIDEQKRDRDRWKRYHRDTTKKCGGGCCANPRKRGELTLQELRFLSSLKD